MSKVARGAGFIANIVWLVTGGIWLALAYVIAGIFASATIILIPNGLVCFQFAKMMLAPFNKKVVRGSELRGKRSPFLRILYTVFNVIWFATGGLALFVLHLVAALFTAITIVGIPNAIVHFRVAKYVLWPLGAKVVDKDYEPMAATT